MNSDYLQQQSSRLEQEYEALSVELYSALNAIRADSTENNPPEKTINELLTLATHSAEPALRRKARRLEAIDAALCAIRLDLYGICTDCEEPIDAATLDQDPAQPRCHQCQSHSKYHHQRS
ncbi:TraR/DksA family transcriptional regulator [Photobacterium salinisoli]|uniref:TraR/DksA family transcriptional regulator n=1 Tax=Photobacterium salinisoli TaxID=1616783 RepID=UPI000EA0E6DC|nr:conjugal transfer protein TraR [Photobacterium salinisoli]